MRYLRQIGLLGSCLGLLFQVACQEKLSEEVEDTNLAKTCIKILGIAQDAGYPQAHCQKACCQAIREGKAEPQHVVSLGLLDTEHQFRAMIEASPDFRPQLEMLEEFPSAHGVLDALLLTHAHIGHYTGLIHLGKEVMDAQEVNTYVMPKMNTFLSTHGPWSLLVKRKNIRLLPLQEDSVVQLSPNIQVQALRVPHRDEYSETVGFRIIGPRKKVLFIPDIDKWNKWQRDIREEIQQVDVALLDGTFYQNGEIPGRDMQEIPHPFIEESIALFRELPELEKSKIYFIHLNHTNPLLRNSPERRTTARLGFKIAEIGQVINL